MGAFRLNPGCNCCEKMLVWDLGIPLPPGTNYGFFGPYAGLEAVMDQIGVKIDFVTGFSNTPQNFYQANPGWDPYVRAVEDGNWTGDIRDYRLIYWPFPLADTNLDADAGPCAGLPVQYATHPGEPDHQFFGGVPQWWQQILDGEWEGRLFIASSGNTAQEEATFPGDGFATNVFLNTLAAITGMTIDAGGLSDQLVNSTATDLTGSDLTEGLAEGDIPSSGGTTTSISGGEDVLLEGTPNFDLRVAPTWCVNAASGTFIQDFPIMQRNRVEFPIGQTTEDLKTVDFVISTSFILFASPLAVNQPIRRFFHNLYQVPIRAT